MLDYPLKSCDDPGRVAFALDVAAARLAFSLGTPWHHVSDRERRQDTAAGTAVFSRPALKSAVKRMAAVALPAKITLARTSVTVKHLAELALEDRPSITTDERLDGVLSAWRLLSPGRVDLDIATVAGLEIGTFFGRSPAPTTFLSNAAWETLGCLLSAVGGSLPGHYAHFCATTSFGDKLPVAVSAATVKALTAESERLVSFALAVETALHA